MPSPNDAVTWGDLLAVLDELGVKDRVLARLAERANPGPVEPYEAPKLESLGNLNDLLAAGGTQACDGPVQTGTGNSGSPPCPGG